MRKGFATLGFIVVFSVGCAEEVTEPVFLEARLRDGATGIEAVVISATASEVECQARTALAIFKGCPTCEFTRFSCSTELPARFRTVWERRTYRATYMILDHAARGERDARIIFFSVSSSVVAGACPTMEAIIKQKYQGTISCVKGTVG